ncbi:MAG: hypothetical protein ACLFUB_10750 [Cyclobacteriaceae bacterium]
MQSSWISESTSDKSGVYPRTLSLPLNQKSVFDKLFRSLKTSWKRIWPTDRERKEDYIRQLYYLAMADEQLSALEQQYIQEIGTKIGLLSSKITELSHHSDRSSVLFLKPPAKDHFYYIFHLINLLRVDDDIIQAEVERAQSILMNLGYAPDTVDIILGTIENNLKSDISPEQTFLHLNESLGKRSSLW